MCKRDKLTAVAGLITGFLLGQVFFGITKTYPEYEPEPVAIETTAESRHIVLAVEPEPRPEAAIDEYIEAPMLIEESEEEVYLSAADIDLIALVTMAEAEGEPEEGKRLVIDTILNRMDSPKFPDSAHGVIYQKNQFEAMHNGRVNKCYVRDDIRELVKEELKNRRDDDVIFFRTSHYSKYGTPMYQVGRHYFSSI